ncbi:hypothetical protein CBW57_15775 [Yersinia intermedia]|uniref:Uncharacterized protein n=1 Tax=Yersinia intermedia TaxID=631 RepID=A0A208ZVR8_YERIN|nr:hypothetical protein CBW57_15775 [Yersinia intermedia]
MTAFNSRNIGTLQWINLWVNTHLHVNYYLNCIYLVILRSTIQLKADSIQFVILRYAHKTGPEQDVCDD